MFKVKNALKGGAALLLVLQSLLFVLPQVASAAASNPSYCDSSIDALTNQNIQDKVPIIAVHGINGSPSDWGAITDSDSFASSLNAIPGAAVADLFSYTTSGLAWVDSPGYGPKLAKTIDCVSQLSLHNGGKGKVIVVAYSLGGLVARDALSRYSSDGTRAIADEVGQVVTIASPNKGTTLPFFWPQLASLPRFPSQMIVHAIAGDVTRVYYDQATGQQVGVKQPHDDTLVSVASALDEYSPDYNKGGGQAIMTCQKNYTVKVIPFLPVQIETGSQDAPCEHSFLIKNATNGVRPDTIAAIKRYLAFTSTKSLTIGTLTTTYDGRWANVGYGASGPGQDGSADDTTNSATCTNCTTTPPPMVDAFIQITNLERWCTGDLLTCEIGSASVVGPAPAVTIGGRTPDSSARYYDSGYLGTSLVWCFNAEKVCVEYRRATDSPQLNLSQALLDVFNAATWSTP